MHSNATARELQRAIDEWNQADTRLELAARNFLKPLFEGDGDTGRGRGTAAAIDLLRKHLAYERYRTPAAILRAIDDK